MNGKLSLATLTLATALTSCAFVQEVFGQPKGHATIVTGKEQTVIEVKSGSDLLKNAAVSVRGNGLSLSLRSQNANCFTTPAKELLYCKFGDLTPYSIGTITYAGNSTKAELAYLDTTNTVITEQIKY